MQAQQRMTLENTTWSACAESSWLFKRSRGLNVSHNGIRQKKSFVGFGKSEMYLCRLRALPHCRKRSVDYSNSIASSRTRCELRQIVFKLEAVIAFTSNSLYPICVEHCFGIRITLNTEHIILLSRNVQRKFKHGLFQRLWFFPFIRLSDSGHFVFL